MWPTSEAIFGLWVHTFGALNMSSHLIALMPIHFLDICINSYKLETKNKELALSSE
jgi:hypothetical protein